MEIDVDKLIELKIPLDGWLVLWTLHNEEQDVLSNYVNNVNKIPTKIFKDLINEGWLETTSTDDTFTLQNINITDKFSKEILGIVPTNGLTFSEAFEQLRDTYPTKAGTSERRLQGNVARCKSLYEKIIMKGNVLDEELHQEILLCIHYEIKTKTKTRSLEYFKMLATWLQQREWELYIDEVRKLVKDNGGITPQTNSGFTKDV